MPTIVALRLSASYPMLAGLQEVGSWLALDQLALQQQINANLIFHAISNYKKTPLERKSLDFVAKKRLQLQMLWREFRLKDKQIRRGHRDVRWLQHGYFQQELYELVREKYMAARGCLSRDKRNLLTSTLGQPELP